MPTPDASIDAGPPPPIEVTWTLTREPDRLRIDYTVANHTDVPIILCDHMRSTKGPVDRAVVQPSDIADTVAFTLAFVRPVQQIIVEIQPRPIANPLAAGSTTSGTAYVKLPLDVYHPIYDPPLELPRNAKRAVLEIGYVDATGPLDTEKRRGQTFEVPSWGALRFQQLARGPLLRLPL